MRPSSSSASDALRGLNRSSYSSKISHVEHTYSQHKNHLQEDDFSVKNIHEEIDSQDLAHRFTALLNQMERIRLENSELNRENRDLLNRITDLEKKKVVFDNLQNSIGEIILCLDAARKSIPLEFNRNNQKFVISQTDIANSFENVKNFIFEICINKGINFIIKN